MQQAAIDDETRGDIFKMPAKLTTTIAKIGTISNPTNAAIVHEFSNYLKGNGASESHC